MGSSSSKQQQQQQQQRQQNSSNISSPSGAYGRLRIHESPRLSSRSRQQAIHRSPLVQRSLSSNTLEKTETTPLLLPVGKTLGDGQNENALTGGNNQSDNDNDDVYDDDSGGPSLAQWIIPALLCGISYAFYNIFIKLGSYSIHPVLGGVILQLVAAALGLALLVRQDRSELEYDSGGVRWSVCAGLAVGLAELLSFFVSGTGVPAVQSIPVIIGGSVAFGTLLGLVLLKERLTWRGWLGVAMLVGGICLVGTDPGVL